LALSILVPPANYRQDIGKLGLAWSLDVDSPMGMASEPIVVDGMIYVTASWIGCLRSTRCPEHTVDVRSACSAYCHAQLVGRSHQPRRSGVGGQSVRRHGRLPHDCFGRSKRKADLGVAGVRRHHSNRNYGCPTRGQRKVSLDITARIRECADRLSLRRKYRKAGVAILERPGRSLQGLRQ